MAKIKKFLNSTLGRVILIVLAVAIGFTIRTELEQVYNRKQSVGKGQSTVYKDGNRAGRDIDYAENVAEDNKILLKFKELYPEAKILVACEEDLTNDGCKDLVLVMNNPEADEFSGYTQLTNGGHIRLAVMIDSGDGENYECSLPIPAPVENQRIKFQNIDSQEEIEFILQGQKGAKVGYGIFRVMDGEPISLFDQGFEEC